MDIHSPKAAHSIREFLIEIGTIICGILIALALEQAVDWSRTRHEIAEARDALRSELRVDAANLRAMAAEDACVDRRLTFLEAWAQGKAQIDRPNFASMQNRPILFNLQASAWEATKSSAVAARMPVSERLAYAEAYDEVSNQMGHIIDERHAWDLLARYAGKKTLSAEEARTLEADIGSVRVQDAGRRFNTPYLIQAVERLGVKSGQPTPSDRDPQLLCQAPQ
jgi:hypothetical protein